MHYECSVSAVEWQLKQKKKYGIYSISVLEQTYHHSNQIEIVLDFGGFKLVLDSLWVA